MKGELGEGKSWLRRAYHAARPVLAEGAQERELQGGGGGLGAAGGRALAGQTREEGVGEHLSKADRGTWMAYCGVAGRRSPGVKCNS